MINQFETLVSQLAIPFDVPTGEVLCWIQPDLAMTDHKPLYDAWLKYLSMVEPMTADELDGSGWDYGVKSKLIDHE